MVVDKQILLEEETRLLIKLICQKMKTDPIYEIHELIEHMLRIGLIEKNDLPNEWRSG